MGFNRQEKQLSSIPKGMQSEGVIGSTPRRIDDPISRQREVNTFGYNFLTSLATCAALGGVGGVVLESSELGAGGIVIGLVTCLISYKEFNKFEKRQKEADNKYKITNRQLGYETDRYVYDGDELQMGED